MAGSWNIKEVEAIVKDYFDMLSHELGGEKYNKSAHRRGLTTRLNGRSEGSIERKYQNISAILIELGMPYISGYKPLKNYQRTVLPDAILDFLAAVPTLRARISEDVEAVPKVPPLEDILNVMVAPPKGRIKKKARSYQTTLIYPRGPVDYLEREASNRNLGAAGEEFVIKFERARLTASGKETLAERIEHVSVTKGDQACYDIRSFEVNGKDRLIEAKTTKYGIDTPFYITANELRFSESHRNNYQLYRVFEFRKKPRLFTLFGYIKELVDLSPTSYLARI